ncbi:20439_t:CDS:2, partial [Racocetra persica]
VKFTNFPTPQSTYTLSKETLEENWLRYIFEEKLKAEEAGEILRYLQERKKEEKVVRKKSQRIKDIKSNLKKYQLKTEKLTPQDIEKFDKEEKRKKKSKPTKITEEIDLDQEKQEPEEEKIKLSKFSKRKRNK